jgi:hypothetical protein
MEPGGCLALKPRASDDRASVNNPDFYKPPTASIRIRCSAVSVRCFWVTVSRHRPRVNAPSWGAMRRLASILAADVAGYSRLWAPTR